LNKVFHAFVLYYYFFKNILSCELKNVQLEINTATGTVNYRKCVKRKEFKIAAIAVFAAIFLDYIVYLDLGLNGLKDVIIL